MWVAVAWVHDEEVATKQVVPGVLGDDPDRQPILRVGSGKRVEHVELLTLQRIEEIAVQHIPSGLVHRLVDLAPGDLRLARRFAYDKFVIRRATGVLPCEAREWAVCRQDAFLAPDSILIQDGVRQIPSDTLGVDSLALEAHAPLDLNAHLRLQGHDGQHYTQNLRIVLSGSIQVNNSK